MPRPIGYYVHHQGAGHRQRARLIAAALERPCTLIGTIGNDGTDFDGLILPDDRMGPGFDGHDGTDDRPEALHYAPVGHPGVRDRMAMMAVWIAANDPALLIVDVSVEVAIFARLLSVPVVLMRLAGRRDDQPHREAFRAAEALVAPFPATFESPSTPDRVVGKTTYLGFLAEPTTPSGETLNDREIAVVLGRGGHSISTARLAEAARAVPDWSWEVYGDVDRTTTGLPANLRCHGWQDAISPALDRAALVVGGAGDGLLAAVAAKGKRFICLPESRAFDEQVEKAAVLDAQGWAIVLTDWPDASEWLAVVRRALALDPAGLRALYDPGAISNAAAAIERIASRFD